MKHTFPPYLIEAAAAQTARRQQAQNISEQPCPSVKQLLRWRKAHIYDHLDPAAPNYKLGKTLAEKIQYLDWLYQYVSWQRNPAWKNAFSFIRAFQCCFEPEKLPWQWRTDEWWDPYHWNDQTRPYQIGTKQVGARFRPGMDVVPSRNLSLGWAWGPENTVTLERGKTMAVIGVEVLEDGTHAIITTAYPGKWLEAERYGLVPAGEWDG